MEQVFSMWNESPRAPFLWCDNLSISTFTANPILHARIKHIEFDMKFIHDKVLTCEFLVHYILLEEKPTNCFKLLVTNDENKVFGWKGN